MRSAIEFIDMDREELNQLVERARASLSAEEYRKLKGVVEALSYLTDLVADQQTTIRDLRELLFPAATEKTEAALKRVGLEGTSKAVDQPGTAKPGERKPSVAGHGRNGAGDYRNPRRVRVSHESLKPGDKCPGCLKGKVSSPPHSSLLVSSSLGRWRFGDDDSPFSFSSSLSAARLVGVCKVCATRLYKTLPNRTGLTAT